MGWRSSSHARYDCKYHLIWCPKRRKKLGDAEVRIWVAETMRRVGEEYDIEIEELAVEEDHVHVFASFPPRYSVARVVGILKGVTASRAFQRFAWLRERFWSGELWEDGYAVRTVGDKVTAELVQRYFRRHEEEATNQPELF
jgi:putative transposase